MITAFHANNAAMPINMTQSSGRRSRSGIFFFRCGGRVRAVVILVGGVQGLKRSMWRRRCARLVQASESFDLYRSDFVDNKPAKSLQAQKSAC